MKLMTKALAKKIPDLYETEAIDAHKKIARVKLFLIGGAWTWYIVEYDGLDTCWGLVENEYGQEFGYFSLTEMGAIKKPLTWIERDLFFKPTTISELMLKRIEEGV